MKLKLSMALATSAMLPLAVFAASPQANPADPADSADPVINGGMPTYESAFRGYRPWKDVQDAPPKTWRAANDSVAQSASGMAGMTMGKDTASDTTRMPADHVMRHKGK